MSQILCSTGALIGRPNNRDYTLLKELAGKLECDGFEFMMYESWYDQADRLVAALKEFSLHIPVMHCEKHIGEAISAGGRENMEEAFRRYRMNCDMAEKLGAGKLVIHLWDGITSDSHFENNLEAFGELRKIAESKGIDLLVENVVCNCENPMKHWCELAERYPDVHFIFDTKMAAFHEQLDLLYREEYAWLWKNGHIRHFHVNDYGGGYMEWAKLKTLPIGAGHIDFAEFFDFIRRTGYDDTFTVEATAFNSEGIVDTEMLNRCFRKIREYLSQRDVSFVPKSGTLS